MPVVTFVAFVLVLASGLFAVQLLNLTVDMPDAFGYGERILWAGGLVLLSLSFFSATCLYTWRVATQLILINDGRTLRVDTLSLFGTRHREVAVSDLRAWNYHTGDISGEEAMSPPWLWVKVRRGGSFVLPLSGFIPDRGRLLRVLAATDR
jgi:hypothetical protein